MCRQKSEQSHLQNSAVCTGCPNPNYCRNAADMMPFYHLHVGRQSVQRSTCSDTIATVVSMHLCVDRCHLHDCNAIRSRERLRQC